MALPIAVHHRLDLLAEAAQDVGATRAEIVAMLIAGASLDSAELEQEMMRYRKLRVGEVIPDRDPAGGELAEGQDADNVISIAKRGPGRPNRHASG